MGLILPHTQQGSLGTNAAASLTVPGQTITAHATPHTKGTAVEISAATARDWYGVEIMIMNDSTSNTVVNNLVDLCVGAAGSEVACIPNIVGTHGTGSNAGGSWAEFWPIFIPAGTRVSARKQSNVTVKTSNFSIWQHSGSGPVPHYRCFQKCIDIGTNLATSGGLPHTAGNSGAYSTYVNIGSTLPCDIKAIKLQVGTADDNAMAAVGYNFMIGIGGTQIGSGWQFSTNATEYIGHKVPIMPQPLWIPAGTQLQIRGACTGTAENLQFALYGFC